MHRVFQSVTLLSSLKKGDLNIESQHPFGKKVRSHRLGDWASVCRSVEVKNYHHNTAAAQRQSEFGRTELKSKAHKDLHKGLFLRTKTVPCYHSLRITIMEEEAVALEETGKTRIIYV